MYSLILAWFLRQTTRFIMDIYDIKKKKRKS